MKYFVIAVCALVAIAIIVGFIIIGSPSQERARQFDRQRVNDLGILQSEIVSYWQRKNELPQSLDDLKNDFNNFTPPRDPETGQPYEYTAESPLRFTLCAHFNLADDETRHTSPSVKSRPYGSDSLTWQHGPGRACFERTIDPDYFKDGSRVPPPVRIR